MKQLWIETSHASIDINSIEQIYLYYFESIPFLKAYYIFLVKCFLATIQNIESMNIATSVFSDSVVN